MDRPPDTQADEYLTVAEAAARLGLSHDAVLKRLKRRKLVGIKVPSARGQPEWRVLLDSRPPDTAPTHPQTLPPDSPGQTDLLTGWEAAVRYGVALGRAEALHEVSGVMQEQTAALKALQRATEALQREVQTLRADGQTAGRRRWWQFWRQ